MLSLIAKSFVQLDFTFIDQKETKLYETAN